MKKAKHFIHGMTKTRLHNIWGGIKVRCYNKNHKSFKNYGARGIKMCDLWKNSFVMFYQWAINNGYNDNLTIERKDVNKDYCPENCKWITKSEQCNNRRNTHKINYHGEEHNLKEWSQILGIKYDTLHGRIFDYGWDIDTAFTKNIRKRNNI